MPSSPNKEFQELRKNFEGELRVDEPLSKHTYFQIGGPARYFAVPKNLEDLSRLRGLVQKIGMPYFFLGAGSNLLVSDEGFPDLVIKVAGTHKKIERNGDRISVGSGTPVMLLLQKAMREGWGGLQFLAGIPGTIGGVIFMNAGTYLGEAKSVACAVGVFDFAGNGDVEWIPVTEDSFDYRRNKFLKNSMLVYEVVFRIQEVEPAFVTAEIQELMKKRKAAQPVDQPTCGSVFKNPKKWGKHSWEVIDELGLRGHRIGNACFSEKHANFIVNLGGAKAIDVKALIDLAKNRALSELGIELEEEVRYLG